MSDYLVNLSRKGWFRGTVRGLGLPIPLPATLKRAEGPWTLDPLRGRSFQAEGGHLSTLLEGLGATPAGDEESLDLAVLDARELVQPEQLVKLHEFFSPRMKRMARNGRLLVIGQQPATCEDYAAQATAGGLAGFIRSCAKELGKKGVTANLVTVAGNGDLAPALAFFGSLRSAFITGQVFGLGGEGLVAHSWSSPLLGKKAVITGAARGIGLVTAERFVAEGAELLMVDLGGEDGLLEKEAERLGAQSLALDVTDDDAGLRIAAELGGAVDIVIHNAGITRDRTLAKMATEKWQQAVDVNLGAVAKMMDSLPLRDEGRIVVLSSVAGLAGNFGQTNYAAAKSGLAALVECYADQLGARGITLNAIAPGFIETRLTAAIPFATREGGRRLSALGQGGIPLDVAEAITFLSLPAAQQITGQVLRVCGGSYLGA